VRYRVGDVSPELVATGRGHLADAILRAAADIGVPVWAYRLTGRRPPA
jgi:type III secretion system FlhB-like substrate exporter